MASWFQFKGKKSTELGVYVTAYPPLTLPEERVEFVEAPGRAGSLTVTEGEDVYEDTTLAVACLMRNLDTLDAVSGWLRGADELVLGNRPGVYYKARVINQIEIEKIVRGHPHRSFSVVFRCKPFRYQHPGASVTLTRSAMVPNPGNLPSEPLITVYGSGDVNLLVGTAAVLITGMTSPIVLDSEARTAYLQGTGVLATGLIALIGGTWPMLSVGSTPIQWIGAVSELQIRPNWRWR